MDSENRGIYRGSVSEVQEPVLESPAARAKSQGARAQESRKGMMPRRRQGSDGDDPHVTFVPYSMKLREDQLAALRMVHKRDGIPVAEQIRRGIDHWLSMHPSEDNLDIREMLEELFSAEDDLAPAMNVWEAIAQLKGKAPARKEAGKE